MTNTSYTRPTIRRGKKVDPILKGKKKEQAEAVEKWYVEFYFTDRSVQEKAKRFKIWDNINTFNTFDEKCERAEIIRQSHTELLAIGFNPLKPKANDLLKKQTLSITIVEAVNQFLNKANELGLRKKSIQTYASKLEYLKQYFKDAKVIDVDAAQLQMFMTETAKQQQWNPRTSNAARQVVYALFKFLIKQKYIEVNPVLEIDRLKVRETSQSHKPISPTDLPIIIRWLSENDPFTCLFVKVIYYTCIRPKELRQVTISMIDIENRFLIVPGVISKNGKTEQLVLDSSLIAELLKLNLGNFKPDDYLFSNTDKISGASRIGENTPYNRFKKCLQTLKLDNKGYSLYGIKHTSNIIRYTKGEWTLADLMVANRHSSISQTETYLRDLNLQVNLSQKVVPPLTY